VAHTKLLNRRIRSVKNAKQITKAMEIVAVSRMRRVQTATNNARLYAQAIQSVMRQIIFSQEAQHHPFFQPAIPGPVLYIIFSSDRGLAGAFNSNVFSLTLDLFSQDKQTGTLPLVIIFGRKGARFFARFSDINLVGEYEDIADAPDVNIFAPVIETINHGLVAGDFTSVRLIYSQFISTLSQQAILRQLLPVNLEEIDEHPVDQTVYEFEPSIEAALESVLHLYLESQLMKARTDSAASEYAMQMMAMNNANRNAGELIDSLTLELNATRQAHITQEIAEITGGAAALTEQV